MEENNLEQRLQKNGIKDIGESVREVRMYGAAGGALVLGAILGIITATGDYQQTEWYRYVGGAAGGMIVVGGVLGTIEYLTRKFNPKNE